MDGGRGSGRALGDDDAASKSSWKGAVQLRSTSSDRELQRRDQLVESKDPPLRLLVLGCRILDLEGSIGRPKLPRCFSASTQWFVTSMPSNGALDLGKTLPSRPTARNHSVAGLHRSSGGTGNGDQIQFHSRMIDRRETPTPASGRTRSAWSCLGPAGDSRHQGSGASRIRRLRPVRARRAAYRAQYAGRPVFRIAE